MLPDNVISFKEKICFCDGRVLSPSENVRGFTPSVEGIGNTVLVEHQNGKSVGFYEVNMANLSCPEEAPETEPLVDSQRTYLAEETSSILEEMLATGKLPVDVEIIRSYGKSLKEEE